METSDNFMNTESQKPEHTSFFSRTIRTIFKTKGSSMGWIILLSLVFSYILQGFMISLMPILSSLGFIIPLTPLVFWVLVIIILNALGYVKEAKNILRAIGTLLLVLLILGIIGFGVCLLLLSNW